MKRVLIAATLSGLFLSAIPACTARTPQATAQLLLLSVPASNPPGKNVGQSIARYDDYTATHMLLISSPAIARRAIKKQHLDALGSLKGQDPVKAILGGLKVQRSGRGDNAAGESVLTLSYAGPNGDDCLKILAAIIESYQEFLGETYADPNQEVVRLLHQSQQVLQPQLAEKENAYRKFRQESLLNVDAAVAKQRVETVERAVTEAQIEETQCKTRLDLLEAGLKQPGDHKDLLRALKETMRVPPAASAAADSPEILLAVLREDLKLHQARIASLKTLLDQTRRNERAQAAYQVQDDAYRSEIARTQKMLDAVIKRLAEIQVIDNGGTVRAKVIAPPTLEK
jgi:hypothetical protein